MKIKIGNTIISEDHKPYFIADIASNHDGDINRAFKLIELARQSGADAVKFQNFKAKTIVSKSGFLNIGNNLSHQASWAKSVYDVYKDASIPDDWTSILKKKCIELDIEYMTSPYDFNAVDYAYPYVNAYKIGSGDITWIDMLEYIAKKNKPVILATGASDMNDVIRAVKSIEKFNQQLIIMQCNTNYTASKDNLHYINLNVLKTYRKQFPDYILGLSDHTYGHATVLGAIALGARVIEKHFTDDNDRQGPDHKFSMNPETWSAMVKESVELFYALGDGIKKVEENEKESIVVQQRSIFAANLLKKGQVIKKEDLIPLRPINSDGIHPYEIDLLIGRKVNKDIKADTYLTWEDIENDYGK